MNAYMVAACRSAFYPGCAPGVGRLVRLECELYDGHGTPCLVRLNDDLQLRWSDGPAYVEVRPRDEPDRPESTDASDTGINTKSQG